MSTTTVPAPKPTRKPAARKVKRIKKPDQPRTLKKDRLVEMLRRREGATIEEITEAFAQREGDDLGDRQAAWCRGDAR